MVRCLPGSTPIRTNCPGAVNTRFMMRQLTYLANECWDGLQTYCAEVKPGEGRLIDCIDKNLKKVNNRCKQAIADVEANEK